MQVVCVNAGNYQGLGKQYVENLYAQVSSNLRDFRFICFTDDPEDYAEGIKKHPLVEPTLKGWWHKLSLFKPGVFDDGERVLFLDLDTLIVGPLDGFAGYRGEFAMLGPFFKNLNPIFAGAQSGVMAWRGGFGSEIWSAFEAQGFPNFPGGDQAFINSLGLSPDLWQEMLPGEVVSFKGSGGRKLPGANVICFHGLPRPHQVGGWVQDHWK